jgi:glutamate 5-kinase
LDRNGLSRSKRLVVKLGTALLTGRDNHVNPRRVRRIVSQIDRLRREGREVLLVSSGAVGLGLCAVRSTVYPKSLSERQALAAMGQSRLMQLYETCFRKYRIGVGQVLLTARDLHARESYVNVKNTLLKLLEYGAVPIINENDTVSIDEIKFGDNDSLSARVALAADADALVILTDIAGLYDKNPARYKSARRISRVARIDESIAALAQGTQSRIAIGGMATKIRAAKTAVSSGIPVVIASGRTDHVLRRILEGRDVGTFFVPMARRLSQKARWIAHSQPRRGGIVVDAGCRAAVLEKGRSILPVGVINVRGTFQRGDSIAIYDAEGQEIGIGLSNYGDEDFRQIMGQKFRDEIIHRDNFVASV